MSVYFVPVAMDILAAVPGKTVVTLMVDSGLKYLSTDVFARS